MPSIDELLRSEAERWQAEVDDHRELLQELAHTGDKAAGGGRGDVRPVRRARGLRSPRRVWVISGAGLAAAAAAVLITGLALDSSGPSSGSSSSSAAGGAVNRSPAVDYQSRDGGGGGSSAGSAASAPSAAPPAGNTAPLGSTALIRTGSLSLTVPRNGAVDVAAARATGIVAAAGGRVDADDRSTDIQRSATLVLRVPTASLAGVTRQLAALGTVRSQNLQTKDVTAQVADVDSRVTSARAAIAALNRLYAKADTVRDLITVESALAARQSDLEALEAQQRTLAAQTSLATLTLSIDVRTAAAHHDETHDSGFVGGLHSGWHAFTRVLRAIATGAGAILPFAAVALVLAAAGLLVLRRRRRAPVPVPDPSE